MVMKKKLINLGRSRGVLLDRQLMNLVGIDQEWVEIFVDQDLIIIRRADAPQTNGGASGYVKTKRGRKPNASSGTDKN